MTLQRAQLGLLAAVAASAPVSIFASEIFLALSVAVLVARVARRDALVAGTPVDTPLVAFAVWTLLSASFAADPARSHADAKKLLLLAVFYVAVEVMTRGEERAAVLDSVLLGGLALAALVVVQYHLLGFDRLDHRPHGFLGHYMTASGVTMVVLSLAVARLAFDRRPLPRARDLWLAGAVLAGVAVVAAFDAAGRGKWPTWLFVAALCALAAVTALTGAASVRAATAALPFVVAPLAIWALVVAQTRGAWLGALAGLATVAVMRAPRLLLAVAAIVVALVVARPAAVTSRLTLHDASSLDRYYMWQAGIDMVLDRPVFGQGPGMILASYPHYRWPEAPNPQAPHLHNNLLQLAAERGVPGLGLFLWWGAVALIVTVREARGARPGRPGSPAAVGALAALVAIGTAGLFEYNLGDSEVLILVLLLNALPFVLARERCATATAA